MESKYKIGDVVQTMSDEVVTITKVEWIQGRWVYQYETVSRGSVPEALIRRLVKKAKKAG